MSAFRRGFRVAAGQAHRQIAGAKRIARRRGIHYFLFRQLHRGHLQQRLAGDRHQAGVGAALHHHLFNASGVGTGDNFGNRYRSPQRIFIIQRQKSDIGTFQHLLVHLASLLLAGPQARTVVVIENHFPAVGAAFA